MLRKWNTAEDDPRLKWPYQLHARIARDGDIGRDELLVALNDLRKQNEYARQLSCDNRTLKAEVNELKRENRFLTEYIEERDND